MKGLAKAFAQARGFLVSLLFGIQTYDDLLASDKVEGERTWGNANVKYAGRTTSGYDSDTFRKLAGAGGRTQVQVIQEAQCAARHRPDRGASRAARPAAPRNSASKKAQADSTTSYSVFCRSNRARSSGAAFGTSSPAWRPASRSPP
ncbi:hypothetical protein QFZ27_001475 [Inquilinus ginsengisoli]|uniref:hypothetical protein n=1 Tax=Inquilinus ginsengisoli TaxID=363840 RepID=UPI003D1C3308